MELLNLFMDVGFLWDSGRRVILLVLDLIVLHLFIVLIEQWQLDRWVKQQYKYMFNVCVFCWLLLRKQQHNVSFPFIWSIHNHCENVVDYCLHLCIIPYDYLAIMRFTLHESSFRSEKYNNDLKKKTNTNGFDRNCLFLVHKLCCPSCGQKSPSPHHFHCFNIASVIDHQT